MSTDVSSEPRLPSRREQAAERRRQLVRVASRLIEEGGVESLTLPGTSERAGCARTLVYRYFASREDLLMAVLERQRELGVMLALGLRPIAVFRMIFIESVLLAALGLVMGVALAVPITLGLEAHPIEVGGELAAVYELVGAEPFIVFELGVSTVLGTAGVILVVAVLASLYPALKASRARPVDALRSV